MVGDFDARLAEIRDELRELKVMVQSRDGLPFVLEPEAAAQELSVSLPTLRRMIKSGLCRTVLINKRAMVPASEVRRLGTPAVPKNAAQPVKRRQAAITATEDAERLRAALKKPYPKKR
jgi:hypothetical protein